MRLGKTPARINATMLKLATYLDLGTILPLIPAEFGHQHLEADFPMLGNDQYANSVWAGAAHETMLWQREAGVEVTFSAGSVLSDYATVTGFDETNPVTDQGTDMQVAASYRRRIGLLDATGRRHRVGGYVSLTQGDPDLLAAATYVFGAVGVGLRLPEHALDDFAAGKPWDMRSGVPAVAGGHYVPVIARRGGLFDVVTHGRPHQMTEMFYRRYCDEVTVYFTPEFLAAGYAPPGFDRDRLLADMEAFTRR